jgi:azurin
MKQIHHPVRLALCATMLFAVACVKKAPSPGGAGPGSPTQPAQRTADPNLPEVKVTMTGNDQMKFDVTTIEAKPNQKVTVTLKNIGTMPKVSMGHNFVLLDKDMDPQKFMEAGAVHMGADFIAPEYKTKVLANTKLLGPGESDTISFPAPSAAGDYVYICSFPGHYTIGMKGTLTVK